MSNKNFDRRDSDLSESNLRFSHKKPIKKVKHLRESLEERETLEEMEEIMDGFGLDPLTENSESV